MISRTMTMGALVLAIAAAAPALAQTDSGSGQSGSMQSGSAQSGGMQSGGMQGGSMQGGAMGQSSGPKMTKAQTASMKKCQAMPSAKMASNKTCAKLMKMHPEMSSSSM